jgi:hypothetical protein
MDKVPAPFEQLIGEELSAVTFVRDYVQLQFNPPPMLNVMTPITLDSASGRISQNEQAFPNAIIAEIGKVVKNIVFSQGDFLRIGFSDDSSITISLKPEDYVGAEAVVIFGKDNHWGVL